MRKMKKGVLMRITGKGISIRGKLALSRVSNSDPLKKANNERFVRCYSS